MDKMEIAGIAFSVSDESMFFSNGVVDVAACGCGTDITICTCCCCCC